ncbi:RICIN domain-containing protein [Streptomyces paludis]|uniref:Uncharacterized protein n=1 Tax=Streptomyces paludis TaxID=2282738 RepID=A0A345HYF5_9ACTN|nr:hypothetical protein [Streptomyces paludis]AXG81729.1 hypothetical protein DVK44_32905 [Streptomyces paludis]
MRSHLRYALKSLPALLTALTLVLLAPGPALANTPKTRLTNTYSNECLRATGEAVTVASNCSGAAQNFEWRFDQVPGGPNTFKYIKLDASEHPGTCLDNNGSRIYALRCNTGTYQQWVVTRFEPLRPPSGQVGVQLKNVQTGICVDTTRSGSGWRIYPHACNSGYFQQWNISADAANFIGW